MQYQVPQFIEVEDKIFGPLTLKQFIYVAGGAGLSFLIWKFFPHFIALPIAGAIIGFAVTLAFFKVNSRPFIVMLEAAFNYVIRPRLYLWKPVPPKKHNERKKREDEIKKSLVTVPNLSERKLRSLAWSLDINENLQNERNRESQIRPDAPIQHSPESAYDTLRSSFKF